MLDAIDLKAISIYSVRICVVCYVGRVTLQAGKPCRIPSKGIVLLWALGCLAYLSHLLTAFAAYHDWSHQRAVEFTADETERVLGIRNGQGVWGNYLFALVWVIDCGRLLRAYQFRRTTNRTTNRIVGWFFAIMMFSATVVFGPPIYRVLAAPVFALWIWQWSGARGAGTSAPKSPDVRKK